MRKFIKRFKESLIGKILRAIFKLLCWSLEVIIIFIAIVILTQRVTNNEKAFLGFRIFNVATGSMEPEYAVGDILISREKDPDTIEVGDNIVYLGDEGGYSGKIITHNVIQIDEKENGERLFHTKGRANTVEDPIVSEDQLYGVVVQNNVVLAWLCKILTNRYGLYFFVIVPIILYAFVGFVRAQGEKIEQEKEAELERRRRHEEKRRKRKQMEMRQRREVVEIEEEVELEEEYEEEQEEYEEEQEEYEEEELIEEEIIELKPKTTKKSTQKQTTKKKKTEESLEEVKEKPKKTNKSGTTKADKTDKETKTSKTEKEPKQTKTKTDKVSKQTKTSKTNDVELENKKASTRKRAKEE